MPTCLPETIKWGARKSPRVPSWIYAFCRVVLSLLLFFRIGRWRLNNWFYRERENIRNTLRVSENKNVSVFLIQPSHFGTLPLPPCSQQTNQSLFSLLFLNHGGTGRAGCGTASSSGDVTRTRSRWRKRRRRPWHRGGGGRTHAVCIRNHLLSNVVRMKDE